MTALVFVLDRDSVVLGMDTLAIRADDHSPHLYASKVLPVPHLGGVVCGTGSQRMPLEWFVEIETRVVARDFDFLNEAAPVLLPEIWARLDEPSTSTIYHFGYSAAEDCYVGFAFRSKNGFVAERLDYGIGLKPVHEDLIAIAPELLEQPSVHDAIVELIRVARTLDEALPQSERVGIGGEVHLLTLTEGRQIGWATRPWSDFESLFAQMLQRLNDENGA